jgi:hypothetical protein
VDSAATLMRLSLPTRLPHLEGRRAGAVAWVYAATAVAVLVVVAGSFWFNGRDFFGNMPAAGAYGFRTQTSGGRPAIVGPASAEAKASGLARGDRFVSIDGEPVPEEATEFTIGERLSADPDGRIALVTRSRDGTLRTHHLTRRPLDGATVEPMTGLPLWLFIALGFTATQLPLVVWFAASVLLARRRPGDPEAMLFAFAALLISVPAAGFWLNALVGVPRSAMESVGNFGACMLLAAIAGFPTAASRTGSRGRPWRSSSSSRPVLPSTRRASTFRSAPPSCSATCSSSAASRSASAAEARRPSGSR